MLLVWRIVLFICLTKAFTFGSDCRQLNSHVRYFIKCVTIFRFCYPIPWKSSFAQINSGKGKKYEHCTFRQQIFRCSVLLCSLLFRSVLFCSGRMDGRTDMTKLIFALRNFANPCNNYVTSLIIILNLFELRLNWTGHPWWWVSQLEITKFCVAGATMWVC
jgi:hypothetical protein